MKKIFCLILVFLSLNTFAQDADVNYTMGYSTITFKIKNKGFLRNYTETGKTAVCGVYSKYNATMYKCDGTQLKVINADDISDATELCCTFLKFDDGPRPYAMFDLHVIINRIDYETNTIYASANGAEIEIVTFNKEIDAWYKAYGKRENLTPLHIKLNLRNWNYTPESEDSYIVNTKKSIRKVHYRGKRAKYSEKLIHESEYMK
jgi:hypothetical protein